MTDLWSASGIEFAPEAGSYAVFLICQEIDQFGHNPVFAQELGHALAAHGLASRIVDYRQEIRSVQDALRDENCAFFISFNGFGSELSLANDTPGRLNSAFDHYRKPLFDLMHDCPAHDSMAHQIKALGDSRNLLLTDYGYIQDAQELGFRNVHFVPSITFPLTLPPAVRTGIRRSIPILLPVQLPPPACADVFFDRAGGYRQRLFREIYASVTSRCLADLRADARIETRRACREIGMSFDVRDPDHRFLLTGIMDSTKFQRRRNLIDSLRALPVTIVTVADVAGDLLEGFSTAPARSFRDLLTLMTDAACVLCPLPHMTGFHERALGAFTAGAAVVAAPNEVLETNFRHQQDMLVYRTGAELADMLADLLASPDRLRAIARTGQDTALNHFAPERLASTILSMWRRRVPHSAARSPSSF